MLKKEVI